MLCYQGFRASHRSPLKKRCPDGEFGRSARVIDEVSNQFLDLDAFENEDHDLIGAPPAMISAARLREPGRRVATTATRSFVLAPITAHAVSRSIKTSYFYA